MSEIFVSHSTKDIDFVRRLTNSLQYSLGAVIWVSFEHIRPGEAWADSINNALNQCRIMILIVSPDSLNSQQVRKEWRFFLSHDKRIIPVIWGKGDLPYDLNDIQHIDFSSQEYDTALNLLKAELLKEHVQFNEVSIPVKISTNKTGNLFWLCHDLNELYYWLLGDVEKKWIDIGLRQSHHHMVELGLDDLVLSQIRQLIIQTNDLQENQWIPEKRQRVASEVKSVFNTVAQIAQKADPDFDSGPG